MLIFCNIEGNEEKCLQAIYELVEVRLCRWEATELMQLKKWGTIKILEKSGQDICDFSI